MWETVWSGIHGLLDALPFLDWWFYGCVLALVLMFFTLTPMPGARDQVAGCGGTILIGAVLGLVLWMLFGGEEGGKATHPERERIPAYSAQENPERERIPRYSARKDKKGHPLGQALTIFTATTEATSKEDLRVIARDLHVKHNDQDGLAVFFKPKDGELFAVGFTFDDAQAEAALRKVFEVGRAEWEQGKEGRIVVLFE
jgi:hypothetical protein